MVSESSLVAASAVLDLTSMLSSFPTRGLISDRMDSGSWLTLDTILERVRDNYVFSNDQLHRELVIYGLSLL